MSKQGDELIRSMAQALAHAQGKRPGARVHKLATRPQRAAPRIKKVSPAVIQVHPAAEDGVKDT